MTDDRRQNQVNGYAAALRAFDWDFEFTDDSRVRNDAKERLQELRRMQRELDPSEGVWRSIVPQPYTAPQ